MSLGKLLHEGLAGKYLEIFSSPGSKKADDLRNQFALVSKLRGKKMENDVNRTF